jgi:uncharacterized peroxidase-related enzyme
MLGHLPVPKAAVAAQVTAATSYEGRMSRIAPVDPATAQGRTKELLDEVQRTMGSTPNMTKLMAGSAMLDGWLSLKGALRRGAIRLADGERIALAISQLNGCVYCLSAHSQSAASAARLDADEIERARRFESADPRSAAILAFASAVARGRGEVSEDALRAARDAGLSDAALADIVGHVALSTLTNYFNKAFDTDVDYPRVGLDQSVPA